MTKVMDRVVLVFLTVFALAAPLDAGLLLQNYLLMDLKYMYSNKYGGYLAEQKPGFFVGLLWLEVSFQWPLAVVNLYGISLGGRPHW